MKEVVLLNLVLQDSEVGEYKRIEVHTTTESAWNRIEKLRTSNNGIQVLKYDFDTVTLHNVEGK